MIADIPFMRDRFARFNSQIFSSLLPIPQFKVREARSYRGKFFHDRSVLYGDFYTLVLSKSFDMDERELEDVLIHEMIHFYIAFNRIKDKSSHGPQFRSLMNQINHAHGRNIEISYRVKGDSDSTVVRKPKKCYVCVLGMRDGRRLIARVPSTKIFEFHRVFTANPSIVAQTWYASFNPEFQYYPASLTPKAYDITPMAGQALESMDTIEMEFAGRYFQVKSQR